MQDGTKRGGGRGSQVRALLSPRSAALGAPWDVRGPLLLIGSLVPLLIAAPFAAAALFPERMGAWSLVEFLGKVVDRAGVTQPAFPLAVGAILLMERLWPAERPTRSLRVGLAQDFVWLWVTIVTSMTVVTAFVQLLSRVYDTHLAFLTITALETLPYAARFVVAVLVGDFLG